MYLLIRNGLNKKFKKVVTNSDFSFKCHMFSTVIQKESSSLVPKIFKGTLVQNWIKYWKNLCTDYKEVAIDIYKESRAHPIKTSIYGIFAGSFYYCAKHNPNEIAFREQLIDSALRLSQVGELIRNPVSTHHIKWLEQCHNEGIIRRLNLGVISFLWLDNCSDECALYKCVCSHLKPQYKTFHQRIVDVGFLDNWWILEKNMIDYDVNSTEN